MLKVEIPQRKYSLWFLEIVRPVQVEQAG